MMDSLFETQEATGAAGNHIIRVAFESGVDSEFDYLVPDKLWPIQRGQRVEVPFGRANKLQVGFCVCSDVRPEEAFTARGKGRKLKQVASVVDKKPLLDASLLELARWISGYYVCPLGQVLAAMVPAAVKKGAGVKTQRYIYLLVGPGGCEETIKQLRGKKQKQIVGLLRERGAFDSQAALQLQGVLTEVGCTDAPVKKLAEREVIKIGHKTILRSLPAVPESMTIKDEKVVLNAEQREALGEIRGRIDSGEFGVSLLHGVTDSGKTEVYIRAIEHCLRKGRCAIVLLPEIALTAQTVQRFANRFKKIAVMHSGLTGPQRNAQWQKIRAGEADVVIGARSAIFAPVARLGLIVVDEEHEPSYKQDTVPRYHGRDVAIKRAQMAGAHCILGSATPSLEMLFNCRSKKHFNRISLPKRVMNLESPRMKLVDLRVEYSTQKGIDLISGPLAECLKQTLEKKEQAILLLNRRGYSNFVFCPFCKHTLQCRNCDVTLTFHKSAFSRVSRAKAVRRQHIDYGYAVCHYCLAKALVPQKCPLCGKDMMMIGLGSQRLEEQLRQKFPEARLARVDSDSMAGGDYYRLLRDFGAGRIDILAGTQMLAKGLHFPNVTLVGIISADTCLCLPDFRANERTFQLISQVAGRAGRSEKKGVVFVQTFLANQPAIQFALANDYSGFVSEELKSRRECKLPPFWRLAAVILRDRDFEKLQAASQAVRERIDSIIERESLEAVVRGPMPAPISRVQRFHRMQIIVRAPNAAIIQKLFAALRAAGPVRPAVKVAVDIDPVNLL